MRLEKNALLFTFGLDYLFLFNLVFLLLFTYSCLHVGWTIIIWALHDLPLGCMFVEFKKRPWRPDHVVQLIGTLCPAPKRLQVWFLVWAHIPRFWVQSPIRVCMFLTWCFSPSLSPPSPLSNQRKHILGWGFKRDFGNPANPLPSLYRWDWRPENVTSQSHRVFGRAGQEPEPVTEETRELSVTILQNSPKVLRFYVLFFPF